jgi:ABC-type phosphate transport system substrate-binding protein
MRSTLRKGAVAVLAGASAILSLALGGTAVADPNLNNAGQSLPGFLPDSNDVVGTGSDTTQYVINTAAQSQAASNPSVRIASFNAFKPGTESAPVTGDTITIRTPSTTIARPNGSSAGINQLISTSTLDYARSSRFRDATKPAEADLYFIPVLTDGLSYVTHKSTVATDPIRNLDATELAAIYRCTVTTYHPKLPQAGSGTRSYFLAQIGVTEAEVGTCVDKNVQEHDPAPVASDPLAIAPFSTARYSTNPVNTSNPPSNTVTIAATAPTAGVFYVERTVYNVVRKAEYDIAGSRLPAIFGPDVAGSTNSGGYFCDRFANSGSARQGFKIAANCGAKL